MLTLMILSVRSTVCERMCNMSEIPNCLEMCERFSVKNCAAADSSQIQISLNDTANIMGVGFALVTVLIVINMIQNCCINRRLKRHINLCYSTDVS
jgi:hypothetical protein